jgi:aryl-alcohol dehydrogenase-like predicted oxidoreductase
MEDFSKALQVETLQPPYHLFRRDIEATILPYTRTHDVGVLVYGPLAHGLLSGALTEDSQFAPNDWRSKSPVFKGEAYRHNLAVVSALQRFAEFELGITVSRLAVAWTLANPDVHVAATDIELDQQTMKVIAEIIRSEVPVGGPSPETV